MSADKETGTAVAVRDTSQAVAREFDVLRRQAATLARSGLLPKSITHVGRTERSVEEVERVVMAIGLGAQSLGLPLTVLTISKFDVLDGVVEPRVQLMVAAATAKGHELWPIENDEQKAVVGACRSGSTRESTFAFTRKMAADAGLLDEWVDRWVKTEGGKSYPETFVIARDGVPTEGPRPAWAEKAVAAGSVKRKDNWHKYTADQLLKSAFKRAVRWTMGDAVLGIDGIAVPSSPEDIPVPLTEEGEEAVDVPIYVTDKWVRSVAIECARKGLTREERLALICSAIGRQVETSKDVLADEAPAVVDAIQALPEVEGEKAPTRPAEPEPEYAPGEEPY